MSSSFTALSSSNSSATEEQQDVSHEEGRSTEQEEDKTDAPPQIQLQLPQRANIEDRTVVQYYEDPSVDSSKTFSIPRGASPIRQKNESSSSNEDIRFFVTAIQGEEGVSVTASKSQIEELEKSQQRSEEEQKADLRRLVEQQKLVQKSLEEEKKLAQQRHEEQQKAVQQLHEEQQKVFQQLHEEQQKFQESINRSLNESTARNDTALAEVLKILKDIQSRRG